MNDIKKLRFPVGMVILVFLFLIVSSVGITFAYFYFSTRHRVSYVIDSTKSVAVPLCESLVQLAILSYKLKDYSSFKSLVQTKIQENIIDEAFFVLKNGAIVAHSKKEIEQELKGNIGYDEFSYNIELILAPLKENSKEIRIIDYNIIGKKVPFKRYERLFLKHNIYDGIDSNGWLVTKAVVISHKQREEPIGTVNFIISKDRIYNEIFVIANNSKMLIQFLLGVSFVITFILSLFVYLRYKKMQLYVINTMTKQSIPPSPVEEEIVAVSIDEEYIETSKGQNILYLDEKPINITKPIRDAIPVRKRAFGEQQ